jgi:hypothetical protein
MLPPRFANSVYLRDHVTMLPHRCGRQSVHVFQGAVHVFAEDSLYRLLDVVEPVLVDRAVTDDPENQMI